MIDRLFAAVLPVVGHSVETQAIAAVSEEAGDTRSPFRQERANYTKYIHLVPAARMMKTHGPWGKLPFEQLAGCCWLRQE